MEKAKNFTIKFYKLDRAKSKIRNEIGRLIDI